MKIILLTILMSLTAAFKLSSKEPEAIDKWVSESEIDTWRIKIDNLEDLISHLKLEKKAKYYAVADESALLFVLPINSNQIAIREDRIGSPTVAKPGRNCVMWTRLEYLDAAGNPVQSCPGNGDGFNAEKKGLAGTVGVAKKTVAVRAADGISQKRSTSNNFTAIISELYSAPETARFLRIQVFFRYIDEVQSRKSVKLIMPLNDLKQSP